MMLLAGTFALTSCDDDRDSNPTLTQPQSFTLNAPVITGNVDLEKSATVALTWSQPRPYNNFDAPMVPTYKVQISPTGSFNKEFDSNLEDNTGADYFTLEESYNSGQNVEISTATIDRNLIMLNGWDAPSKVPSLLDLAIRVKACIQDAGFREYATIFSNVVTLKTVPYYMELKPADPEIWWLIGADIADGSWASNLGQSVIPLQTLAEQEYDSKTGQGIISWTGYLGGNGFKLVKTPGNWDDQWGQGDGGYVKNDGGSGNITVSEPGIYTVTLSTATDELTIEKQSSTPKVFDGMAISGSFNDWSDTEMTPCSTGWENHDWYITTTLDAGAEIKVKQADSWDFNKGGVFYDYSEGMYAYGEDNGPNLVIAESGTYLIIFNDITGFIRFIKQ